VLDLFSGYITGCSFRQRLGLRPWKLSRVAEDASDRRGPFARNPGAGPLKGPVLSAFARREVLWGFSSAAVAEKPPRLDAVVISERPFAHKLANLEPHVRPPPCANSAKLRRNTVPKTTKQLSYTNFPEGENVSFSWNHSADDYAPARNNWA